MAVREMYIQNVNECICLDDESPENEMELTGI